MGVVLALTVLFGGLVSVASAQESEPAVDEAAAHAAFEEGIHLLQRGEPQRAIPALRKATELNPKEAEFFHQLGRAHVQARDFDHAWKAYRKAAALEPGNPVFANDFLQLWKLHELQGTLNIGTPGPTVVAELGQPDVARQAQFTRAVYGFMAIDFKDAKIARLLDLRGLVEPMVNPDQVLDWGFEVLPFEPNHHLINRVSDHLEMVPSGQTVQAWNEMLSRQRFAMLANDSQLTPAAMMQNMESRLKKMYPETQWTVVSETPQDVLYHWRISGNENQPAQHEIARIIKGQRDYFRIAYVKKTEQLADNELNRWIERLRQAKLTPAQPEDYDDPLYQRMAWELGHTLSMAALLKAQRGPAAEVKRYFELAEKIGTGLNLPVPSLLETTDDQIADLSAALNYLLATTGRPFQQHIKRFHGRSAAALFELAMKANLLTVVYVPGDPTSTAALEAIKRSSQTAGLPESVTREVVKTVEAEADRETVIDAITRMRQNLDAYLKVERNPAGNSGRK